MAGKKMQLRHNSGLNLKGKSFKEVAQLYADNKISWVEAGPAFCEADENEQDMKGLPINYQRARAIVGAYRLLQAQRPEYLKDPGPSRLPIPSTLIYLRFVHRKSDGAEKERVFGEILDGVLDGSIKEPQIRVLAEKAKNSSGSLGTTIPKAKSAQKKSSHVKSRGDEPSITALENMLHALGYMLDQALEKNSYAQLRGILGKRCMDLSARLNCIGDEGFQKLWKERKEGVQV